MVYVKSKNDKALMPCENVIARLLLDGGKAKVIKREPFTIKLTTKTTNYTQLLTLGVDVGSKTSGFAVVDRKNRVLYASEVILRDDIRDKMYSRSMSRHTRRNRKTRYRKPRFNNRKNSKRKDRFSPTMSSKINSNKKEIEYIKSILPITNMIFEMGKFNVSAMTDPRLNNPRISLWGYSRGPLYGFENKRMYVLFRDNYTCQMCGGKNNDHHLEIHHIVPKSQHGSDLVKNLITLCSTCHRKIHTGNNINKINFKLKVNKTLKYATQMNSLRVQLLRAYRNVVETYGYVTTVNKRSLGITKKAHWLDAVIIATEGQLPIFKTDVIYIKRCNAKGDFKQTYGKHSEKSLNRSKMCGILKYDKVRYRGSYYFVKNRYDNRYGRVMDIYGNQVDFPYLPRGKKTPKLKDMKRIAARSSWMVATIKLTL